jgi:hypothetical protein
MGGGCCTPGGYENYITCKNSVGNPERKRLLGRRRCRWENGPNGNKTESETRNMRKTLSN